VTDRPEPTAAVTAPPPDPSAPPDDNEQRRLRQAKRARLLDAAGSGHGDPPYPVGVPRTHSLSQVRAQWGHLGQTPGVETDDVVSVSGRVMFLRNTGKLCFATLQDGFTATSNGERLQVMLSLAELVAAARSGEAARPTGPDPADPSPADPAEARGAARFQAWKDEVDLGDFVSVTGRVIASKRGELSVLASAWTMASKALRPLPVLHKELSEETRVRQRYADLIVRPEARAMVRLRSAVTRALRDQLDDEGFLEVETPVLQLVHGGAAARPFRTHLNAFSLDMTLRIALELHLKRAMVGGADRVYELGRIFRNEGIDSRHSAEFSMLEFYAAWGDKVSVAETTRRLVLRAADVAAGVLGPRQAEVGGQTVALGPRQVVADGRIVDLDGDWRWASFYDLVSEAAGEEITPATPTDRLLRLAADHGVEPDPALVADDPAAPRVTGKLALRLYDELVEPGLLQPTFVDRFPAVAQPLAQPDASGLLVEAWDLIIAGVERGTGFSELIDPVVQRRVLAEQSRRAARGDVEAMELDEDFLKALEYGVPPMGGVGLGLDRLLMLLAGVGIRETILFPLLRPEA